MSATSEPSIWASRELTPDAIRLDGKAAIVTGAARGIGRATALALARFGADVAICDRDTGGMAETAASIEDAGRRAMTAELDVRDQPAVAGWIDGVARAWDRIDVVVNNAGGGFWSPFLDVSDKGEMALINENFRSVTHVVRAAVADMDDGGSIVNVTSIEAHRAGPGFAIYSAMKAAVASLSKSLSMELADRRIRVNCIACDVIPTEGDDVLAADSGAASGLDVRRQSWPELGHVDDCAAATVFLASDMSRFVTGSSLHVDGGNLAAGGWKITDGATFAL